ncbi:MAG: ATP-binding protein [Burkholderiales bacterium]|nr:ATP-binding protein [Burkholderiales bacterium]
MAAKKFKAIVESILSARKMVSVMVVFFLGVWLIPTIELFHLYDLLKKDARNSGQLTAHSLSMVLEANLRRLDEVLLDLRPHVGEPYEKFDARVKLRMKNISDITFHITLADANGVQSYSTLRRNVSNISLADRSYYLRFANNPGLDVLNISEPVIGRVSGKWSVQFTRPVYHDGQFKGIINASMRPEFLTRQITSDMGMPDLIAEVWKSDGTLLARSPEDLSLFKQGFDTKQWFAPSEITFTESPVVPGRFIKANVLAADRGLIFIAATEEENVLQEFWPVAQRVLPITALISFFSIFGVYVYFSRRTSQAAYVGKLKLNRKISGSSQKVARLGDYLWDEETQKFRSSKALNEILGLGAVSFLPLNEFLELVHAEDRTLLHQAVAECDEDGNPLDLVLRWSPSMFGQVLWLRMHGSKVKFFDERTGKERWVIAGIIKDISDIKERELALTLARVEADAANQAKFEFLATMSHELRTPLFGISAGLQIALRDDGLQERTRRALDSGYKSVQHLNQLVDDVLDFAKLDSQALQLASQKFDVVATLKEVMELFSHRANEKKLETSLVTDSLAHTVFMGDERRLRQIFFNLVGNAIKFTQAGSVQLEALSYKQSDTSAQLKVMVKDTGRGIAENDIAKLFRPFEQGCVNTSVSHGGTGLGLSISRALAKLMRGDIEVSSVVGQGSVFTVTLLLDLPAANELP